MLRRPLFLILVAALLAVAPIAALVTVYVEAEHPVYIWDFYTYWGRFKTYTYLISSGSPNWISQLLLDIDTNDYNSLASALLYPVYLIGGDGRISFVIGISLVYLLPAVVITTLVGLRAAPLANPLLIFVMALTYIPYWMPTLRGMVDIVGLIPLGLAALIMFRSDFLLKRPIPYALAIGVLIYLPFLMRRWYAYTIIIFLALSFLYGLATRLRHNMSLMRAALTITLPLMLSGIIAALLLMTLQWDLARRVLSTSYAELYAQFQIPFVEHFATFPGMLGRYFIAMMLVGGVVALATRNLVASFGLLAAAGTFFFFIRTQFFAIHHFLPIAFWLFPVYVAAAAWLADQLTMLRPQLRMVPFVLAGLAVFVISLVPGLGKGTPYVERLLPSYGAFPLHLDNYAEYQRLLADLDKNLGPTGKVTAFSCTMALSSVLISALQPTLTPRVSVVSCIPSLDVFEFDNLRAEYALVRTDERRHSEIDALKSVMLSGEHILSGTGFGAAYERIGDYQLADGESAGLFRRTRPVTTAEAAALIGEFGEAYGKDYRPELARTMRVRLALMQADPGDGPGRVQVMDTDSVFLHPGATTPTRIELPIDTLVGDRPAAVVFSITEALRQSCPQADGVSISMTLGSEPIWSGVVALGASERVALPARDGVLVITVENRASPDCDHLNVAFKFAP